MTINSILPGFAGFTSALLISTAVIIPVSAEETPDLQAMWRIIQEQQKTIDVLQSRLANTDKKVEQTEEALDITAEAIETATLDRERYGIGKRTSVGGYGELHYNNLDDDAKGDGNDSLDRTDFHRFVLYFGHEFTDRLRFFSELELEHALAADTADGSNAGEVELEQAWLEMDLSDHHRLRVGLDILPIGIINPTHEPNTFFGVERNKIESEIIPSTWWEAGLGLNGEIAPGWNYDIVLHSGLAVPVTGGSALRPRSGRLKVSEADDQSVATTGRIRYTGVPGLEVGLSAQYQKDITGSADNFDIEATLLEGHIDWKHRSGFGLRALYARWDMGSNNNLDPGTFNADNLAGWYVEPAYRFSLADRFQHAGWGEIGVFARYSVWDERNQLGAASHRFVEFDQVTTGINWWPNSNVVFKFDLQWEDADATVDRTLDGFNMGIGYQF